MRPWPRTAALLLVAIASAACGGGDPLASGPTASAPLASGPMAPSSGGPAASPAAPIPAGPPPAATVRPAAPELTVGAWAATVVESLNLRQRAGTANPTQGLLPIGASGLVVAGPEEADGYTWYAFAAPGLPWGSGCAMPENPALLTCPTWFGWVAAADQQGNPWLQPTELQCPDAPTTVEAYITIQPGVRLACFSGASLTVRGYLAPTLQGHDCVVGYATDPAWLHICAVVFIQAEGGSGAAGEAEVTAHLHPSFGTCDFGGRAPETCPLVPFVGQTVDVVGHVDDPAAASCTVAPSEGAAEAPDPAAVIYNCRVSFVVTEVRAAS